MADLHISWEEYHKKTEELAVMIDTFKPLYLTAEALSLTDKDYPLSWNK